MAQISLTFDQNRTFEFIVIARGVGRIGGGDGGVWGGNTLRKKCCSCC